MNTTLPTMSLGLLGGSFADAVGAPSPEANLPGSLTESGFGDTLKSALDDADNLSDAADARDAKDREKEAPNAAAVPPAHLLAALVVAPPPEAMKIALDSPPPGADSEPPAMAAAAVAAPAKPPPPLEFSNDLGAEMELPPADAKPGPGAPNAQPAPIGFAPSDARADAGAIAPDPRAPAPAEAPAAAAAPPSSPAERQDAPRGLATASKDPAPAKAAPAVRTSGEAAGAPPPATPVQGQRSKGDGPAPADIDAKAQAEAARRTADAMAAAAGTFAVAAAPTSAPAPGPSAPALAAPTAAPVAPSSSGATASPSNAFAPDVPALAPSGFEVSPLSAGFTPASPIAAAPVVPAARALELMPADFGPAGFVTTAAVPDGAYIAPAMVPVTAGAMTSALGEGSVATHNIIGAPAPRPIDATGKSVKSGAPLLIAAEDAGVSEETDEAEDRTGLDLRASPDRPMAEAPLPPPVAQAPKHDHHVKTVTATDPTPAAPSEEAQEAVRVAESLGHKRVLASGEARGHITVPELGRIEVRAHTSATEAVQVSVQVDDTQARAVVQQHASELQAHVRAEIPQAQVHLQHGNAGNMAGQGQSERRGSHERPASDQNGDGAQGTGETVVQRQISGRRGVARYVL